jgi:hypothetical protein
LVEAGPPLTATCTASLVILPLFRCLANPRVTLSPHVSMSCSCPLTSRRCCSALLSADCISPFYEGGASQRRCHGMCYRIAAWKGRERGAKGAMTRQRQPITNIRADGPRNEREPRPAEPATSWAAQKLSGEMRTSTSPSSWLNPYLQLCDTIYRPSFPLTLHSKPFAHHSFH